MPKPDRIDPRKEARETMIAHFTVFAEQWKDNPPGPELDYPIEHGTKIVRLIVPITLADRRINAEAFIEAATTAFDLVWPP